MTAHARLNALVATLDRRGATLDTMIALGGGLAMDDNAFAQDLKLHGKGVVTHRHYFDFDHELYLKRTVEDWLNIVAAEGANGVLIQCHNEPVINAGKVALFVDWNRRALEAAHARGVNLAVGAFSVGNPAEKLITSGAFDPMLRAMAAKDALVVHEYFMDHPTAPSEHGFLCGRLEWWLERMKIVGCQCRTIIVGEYGRDLGGGLKDGWRDQSWGIEDYTRRCMEGIEQIYQPLSIEYHVNIFVETYCAGHGYGNRWQSWNVEGETFLTNAYNAWNRSHPMTTPTTPTVEVDPAPTSGGIKGSITKMPSTFVNVRVQPNVLSSDAGDLAKGEEVTYFPERQGWVYIQRTAPLSSGWVSLQAGAVEFTPTPPVIVVPPPPPGVTISAADQARIKAYLEVIDTSLAGIRSILAPA